jgi:hypothetical protein
MQSSMVSTSERERQVEPEAHPAALISTIRLAVVSKLSGAQHASFQSRQLPKRSHSSPLPATHTIMTDTRAHQSTGSNRSKTHALTGGNRAQPTRCYTATTEHNHLIKLHTLLDRASGTHTRRLLESRRRRTLQALLDRASGTHTRRLPEPR